MSGLCTYFAGRANTTIMEFVADEISEVQDLPTTTTYGKGVFEAYKQTAPMGSTCTVGQSRWRCKGLYVIQFWMERNLRKAGGKFGFN